MKLATLEFTNYAMVWWDQERTSRRRSRAPTMSTLEELRTIIRKWFVPNHYYRDLHKKLQTMVQGNRSVEDYYKEMEVTMLQADIVEDQEATMARFLNGLRSEIAELVELQNYVEVWELVDKASKIERIQKRSTTRYNNNSVISSWKANPPKRKVKVSASMFKPKVHKGGSKGNNEATK